MKRTSSAISGPFTDANGREYYAVELTRGYFAWIDKQDIQNVDKYTWHADVDHKRSGVYARTRLGDGRNVRMHRVILVAQPGQQVDHKHHYTGILGTLDNRRFNLRIATASQNQANRMKRKSLSSEFKGVHVYNDGRKKPWLARIKLNGNTLRMLCETELDAARYHDKMAFEHFGEFAKLNFPHEYGLSDANLAIVDSRERNVLTLST